MVLQHHERLDGSGYPQGLRNGDIRLEARILAVADVLEAMSSHRPYRAALGVDAALDELQRNRGVLIDPDAVDACVRLVRDRGFTPGWRPLGNAVVPVSRVGHLACCGYTHVRISDEIGHRHGGKSPPCRSKLGQRLGGK